MPRVLGVDLPGDKPTHIALRHLYGIGPTTSLRLCEQAQLDPLRMAGELSEEEVARLVPVHDPGRVKSRACRGEAGGKSAGWS